MKPVRFRLSTRVSRILCIPFFVAFLLLANGASVSANVATSQRPLSLQSSASNRSIRPNIPVYTPCTPPNSTPYTCVPGDGQVSSSGDVVAGGTIAADPNNPMSLVAGGIDKSCNGTENAIFYSSNNGGVSWGSNPNPFCLPNNGTPSGTPAAAFDLNHNSYIATVESGTNIIAESSLTSSGGCSGTPQPSWCTPVTIAPIYAGGSITGNQINMQIDDHAVSPYKNCIYIAARQINAASTRMRITVSYLCPSSPWGSSFTTKVVTTVHFPATAVVSPSLTIGQNGIVYVTWLQCSPFPSDHHCGNGAAAELWISKSTNHGVTWSTPRVITKISLVPDTCSHSLGCIPGTSDELGDGPSVGIDNSNKLYVAYYTYTGSQLQVRVSTATNISGPWSTVRVDPIDTNDEFLPWLSVSPTGTVGVTWLELYTSGPNTGMYQEYGALGPAWVVSPPLSSALSNPNNTWGSSVSYIGDYMDNVWVQTGTSPNTYSLYSVWTDTRSTQDQLYVGGIISLY